MADYLEMIEHLANMKRYLDKYSVGGSDVSERFKGALDAAAFAYDKTVFEVMADVEARLLNDLGVSNL